jgi:DNA-directed RNA polymerase specialized sigma24 family protein
MQRSTDTRRLGATSNALEFELFFEAERRDLFRALYLMTGSVHEAEELAQDASKRSIASVDRKPTGEGTLACPSIRECP